MNNYSKYRIQLALLVITVLGLSILPGSVHALTLTPSRFEVSGNPGDTLTEQMTVINEGDGQQTYYSSYANFEAQGDSGSPAFVTPKDDLGTWMSTQPSVDLSPREQKTVTFKINIPKDAEPGGHFAVIFWGTSPQGQGQVSIGAKTGVLVLLSVNGDVKESAGLLNFNTEGNKFFYSTLPVTFEYKFRNDGGDRIKPVGTISMRDTLFLPADIIDANPTQGNILPASTRKFDVDWVKYTRPVDYVASTSLVKSFWENVGYQWKNFAVGLYSAHFNVIYGAHNLQATKTVFFFVFPWQLVLVMVVVFVIVFWGGKLIIKRYNKYIIERARAGMQN